MHGPGAPKLKLGLVADTHIGAEPAAKFKGGYDAVANAAKAVTALSQYGPQLLVCLGDLARSVGENGDYEHWRRIFAPLTAGRPAVLLPGNHDRRDRMLAHFSSDSPRQTQKAVTVVNAGGLRLIALDSLYRTDVVPGLLGEAQRLWLESYLDDSEPLTTLVFVHHHIGQDDYALLDGDRLLAILQSRAQVKGLVTAHRHSYRLRSTDGFHQIAAPALGMPFDPAERLGWLEAELDASGAQLRFRGLDGAADPVQRIDWRS